MKGRLTCERLDSAMVWKARPGQLHTCTLGIHGPDAVWELSATVIKTENGTLEAHAEALPELAGEQVVIRDLCCSQLMAFKVGGRTDSGVVSLLGPLWVMRMRPAVALTDQPGLPIQVMPEGQSEWQTGSILHLGQDSFIMRTDCELVPDTTIEVRVMVPLNPLPLCLRVRVLDADRDHGTFLSEASFSAAPLQAELTLASAFRQANPTIR